MKPPDHCTGVPDLWFGRCCARHDVDYGRQRVSRRRADRRFLLCMLRKAGTNKKRRRYAYLYYRGVRTFGWFFWWKAGRKR